MSNDLVSLLLDIVILVLLGATIFYVVRLTKGLKEFKEHRQEFDSVIANLLASIDQADHSVRTLKKVSAEEAGRLEKNVAQAKLLSDELMIITETGENMAKRLEKLAETNRKIVQPAQGRVFSQKQDKRYSEKTINEDTEDKIISPVHRDKNKKTGSYDKTLRHVRKEKDDEHDLPSFMVERKDDYERMNDLEDQLESSVGNDGMEQEKDVIIPRKLQSQAEKDLFDALRATRKKISGNE